MPPSLNRMGVITERIVNGASSLRGSAVFLSTTDRILSFAVMTGADDLFREQHDDLGWDDMIRSCIFAQIQSDEPLPERRRGDVVLQLVVDHNGVEFEGVALGPRVIETACRNGTETG
jgi:hypothetical protein